MANERVIWDRGAVKLLRRWGPIKCTGSLYPMYDDRYGWPPFDDQPTYYVLRFHKPRGDSVREYVYRNRPTQAEILRVLRRAPRLIEVGDTQITYSAYRRKYYPSAFSAGVDTLAEARAQALGV